MDKELAEKLVEVLQEELEDVEIYIDYSGRGMYSKTTTGITFKGDVIDVVKAVINHAHEFCLEDNDELGYPDAEFTINNLRADSMGLGTIIY